MEEKVASIGVYIPDADYGITCDDYSEDFRRKLAAEFGGRFEEANIGPGAAVPAWVHHILLGPWPSIQLHAFQAVPYFVEENGEKVESPFAIGDRPDPLFLSTILHVFRIEAEQRNFRIVIRGHKAEITEEDK